MPADPFTHFVFVDFENVPKVDLGLAEGRPVHVTLLIGKKQTKLDLSLVQQIRCVADQVELVEVGATGHNALDLTLAYYLGRAVQRDPRAQFSIVSKDKDFEPMIGHLSGLGVRVARSDTFAAVFQPPAKKPGVTAKTVPAPKKAPKDRLTQLIEQLKNNPTHRPKKQARLLHHIGTFFGNKLDEAGQAKVLGELIQRRIVVIEDKDKVRYL
jgi:hypothetical protein